MIDINKAEHYAWGNRCDGWHLLKSPEISVIQERCRQTPLRCATCTTNHASFFTFYGARRHWKWTESFRICEPIRELRFRHELPIK